jgi:CelD/BcsL family acetyltransferase involved in cellulose biosynthesis
MSRLRVEERCGAEALSGLRAEWQALFRASEAAPFLSWEWAAAWQQWLGRSVTPRVLTVREGGRLVGLLALGEEERRLAGALLSARRLAFLGAGFGGADYLDVLALPGCGRDVAQAVGAHLARCGQFDVLELNDMAADSPTVAALAEEFGAASGCRFHVAPRFFCPQVELADGWAATLKRSRRAENFKRRLRHFRAREGFAHRAVTRPDEATAALERFFVLHEARRADLGGSEATGHAALKDFHRDLVVRMAEAGLLRFDELWAEGACRASIYGLDDGRRYSFYNSGYDPAWANLSPGLVLLGLSIESAAGRGIARYDFLRGEEAYKFDWATGTRETVAVRVARRSASAAVLVAGERAEMAARGAAEALLPAAATARLRDWRRAWRRGRELAVASRSS